MYRDWVYLSLVFCIIDTNKDWHLRGNELINREKSTIRHDGPLENNNAPFVSGICAAVYYVLSVPCTILYIYFQGPIYLPGVQEDTVAPTEAELGVTLGDSLLQS